MSKSIAVLGANRGIGLAIVEKLVADTTYSKIFATARKPDAATKLNDLAKNNSDRLHVVKLDITDASQCSLSASETEKILGNSRLDELIVNAGQYGKSTDPSQTNVDDLDAVIKANLYGPIQVVKAWMPIMNEKSGKGKIVLMSSDAGSIEMKRDSKGYSGGVNYWISKAALNMYGISLANELREKSIAVLCLHPGWIQTDMGGKSAPLTLDDAVPGIMQRIADLNLETTGAYLNYAGKSLPF